MSSPAPELQVSVEVIENVAHIRLAGELDFDTSSDLLATTRRVLAEHARPGSLRQLRLDCAGLSFCDTMGLSALLTIRRDTETAGIELLVANRSVSLQRLLELSGTLDHFSGANT
jgi:anti-anti-sigma factor